MTLRTGQVIALLSFLAALIAGIASEISVREAIGTPAGYIPLAVMICVFVGTAGVLTILAKLAKRNNP